MNSPINLPIELKPMGELDKDPGRFARVMALAATRRAMQGMEPVELKVEDKGQAQVFSMGNQTWFSKSGDALTTRFNKPQITFAMVQQMVGTCSEINVVGKESFRRDAWLYGMQAGLKVNGYDPKGQDLVTLKMLQEKAPAGTIKAGPEKEGPGVLPKPEPVGPAPKEQAQEKPIPKLSPKEVRACVDRMETYLRQFDKKHHPEIDGLITQLAQSLGLPRDSSVLPGIENQGFAHLRKLGPAISDRLDTYIRSTNPDLLTGFREWTYRLRTQGKAFPELFQTAQKHIAPFATKVTEDLALYGPERVKRDRPQYFQLLQPWEKEMAEKFYQGVLAEKPAAVCRMYEKTGVHLTHLKDIQQDLLEEDLKDLLGKPDIDQSKVSQILADKAALQKNAFFENLQSPNLGGKEVTR